MTTRQNQALALIGRDGLSVDQTADAMQCSRSAVEKLLARARVRLGARNLVQAVYLAAKQGAICLLVAAVFLAGSGSDVSLWRRQSRRRRQDDCLSMVATGRVKGLRMQELWPPRS